MAISKTKVHQQQTDPTLAPNFRLAFLPKAFAFSGEFKLLTN